MEPGSAALRVDWPVYPRRAEHNTVAEGGNRRWAETPSAGAIVGARHVVPDAMRQAHLGDLELGVRDIGTPRAKPGSEAVDSDIDAHAAQEHRQGHIAEWALGNDAEEHEAVAGRRLAGGLAGLDKNGDRPIRQWDAEGVVGLHPLFGHRPRGGVERDLVPLCAERHGADDLFPEYPVPKRSTSQSERSFRASNEFTEYRRSVGVEEVVPGRRRSLVNFHSFRRYFITKAEQADHMEHIIAVVVGHKRTGMTLGRYSGGPLLEQARRCVEAVKLP